MQAASPILSNWQRLQGGAVSVQTLPQDTGGRYQGKTRNAHPLRCRELKRAIVRDWRISSFSSLTAHRSDEQREWPDRDDTARRKRQFPSEFAPFQTLFDFPRGTHAGLFFHDLLEHWEHTETDRRCIGELIRSKLKIYGFDLRWEKAIDTLLVRLARTALPAKNGHFALTQVPVSSRINEISFYFPLKAFSPDDLSGGVQSHWPWQPSGIALGMEIRPAVLFAGPGIDERLY